MCTGMFFHPAHHAVRPFLFARQHFGRLPAAQQGCLVPAVAESSFPLLKRGRIRRRTCFDREEARRDAFDYIEMSYNPKRRHGHANRLSPVGFEKQYFNRLESVSQSRGDS